MGKGSQHFSALLSVLFTDAFLVYYNIICLGEVDTRFSFCALATLALLVSCYTITCTTHFLDKSKMDNKIRACLFYSKVVMCTIVVHKLYIVHLLVKD